jgi:transcriptional regulator with XRE-family HTH domain
MIKFNRIAFANMLASVKRKWSLTAKEISKRSGIPVYKITNWKTGRSLPTEKDISMIAEVLDVPSSIFWEEVKLIRTNANVDKDAEDLALFKALVQSIHQVGNIATICKMVFDLWYKENFPQC